MFSTGGEQACVLLLYKHVQAAQKVQICAPLSCRDNLMHTAHVSKVQSCGYILTDPYTSPVMPMSILRMPRALIQYMLYSTYIVVSTCVLTHTI